MSLLLALPPPLCTVPPSAKLLCLFGCSQVYRCGYYANGSAPMATNGYMFNKYILLAMPQKVG